MMQQLQHCLQYLRSCLCPWAAGLWLDTDSSADGIECHLHIYKCTHRHRYVHTSLYTQKQTGKKGRKKEAALRSKKQEMVGLLTPNVVVTDLSSFLSSILLCGGKVGGEEQNRNKTFYKHNKHFLSVWPSK